MDEGGFGETLCSGLFINRGPDHGKEGSHPAALSRKDRAEVQTHQVYGVGSFGPTTSS
jgi:hypothetical protein